MSDEAADKFRKSILASVAIICVTVFFVVGRYRVARSAEGYALYRINVLTGTTWRTNGINWERIKDE